MSGIVGIVNLDGAPVERGLLERLTGYLAFRGPDRQEVWQEGSVGFGHTLLRTTPEGWFEQQPFSLDGESWITADARVDGRTELIERLGLEEGLKLKEINDAELILRAYLKWGEECVAHLIGDFAFAIWDGRKQKLFCARDQFGVKLFYYARVGNCLIFSNTLNCIRQHPLVSERLNEQAIGDFLLFDMNYNLETTFFSDIQRLPGGHVLSLTRDGTFSTRRYWTLPVPEPVRYKRDSEYIEHFKEVMGQAVGDRLRNETEKVGIMLSGGLDSNTITATALDLAKKQNRPLKLKACTAVHDYLIPDNERYYTSLAARAHNIEVEYLTADKYRLFEGCEEEAALRTPEPYHDPLSKLCHDKLQIMANFSRVSLSGDGGDEALKMPTLTSLVKSGLSSRLAGDIFRTLFVYRLYSNFGVGLKAALRTMVNLETISNHYEPLAWINTEFLEGHHLEQRFYSERRRFYNNGSFLRVLAYIYLTFPWWSANFENNDPGISQLPLEVRSPFFDLRLVNYLLAIPPLPWCVGKEILRQVLKDTLPSAVRYRPKTTVQADMYQARGQAPWDILTSVPEVGKYVNVNKVIQAVNSSKDNEWVNWENLRPLTLTYWLKTYRLEKTIRLKPALAE
ncbi:MAG TPA: asparagine synthase-related protein [Chloroflexia bacterium]|nr:asparagine synthase-related protein [Chloroflexia bacterium]